MSLLLAQHSGSRKTLEDALRRKGAKLSAALFVALLAWAVLESLSGLAVDSLVAVPVRPGSPSPSDLPLVGGFDSDDELRKAVSENLEQDPRFLLGHEDSAQPSEDAVPWPEAEAELRTMCADFGESDHADFQHDALYWPGDLRERKAERFPDFSNAILNPDGKKLGPVHTEELEGIVTGYNALLKTMAKDSAEMAKNALLDYFDKGLFEKFPAGQVPPPSPMATQGHYALNSSITHRGWTVRTRFSSLEYPQLESLLTDIETLKAERLRTVRGYIAGLQ